MTEGMNLSELMGFIVLVQKFFSVFEHFENKNLNFFFFFLLNYIFH